MLKIENVEVWEAAIRGMRNPMNSWEKSDSYMDFDGIYCGIDLCPECMGEFEKFMSVKFQEDKK